MKLRNSMYWLSIASCLMLAGLFFVREQYVSAGVMGLVVVVYLVRLVLIQREDRALTLEHIRANEVRSVREKQALVDDLRSTRDRLRASQNKALLVGLLIFGGIGLTYQSNPYLAFAFSIFLIPVGYRIFKNGRMISEISRGLVSRGYSLQARLVSSSVRAR